jgi:hypothetical protein
MVSKRLGFWFVSALICVVATISIVTIGSGKLLTTSQTDQRMFTGVNQQGDFQKALADALVKAQEAAGCCDRLVAYRVTDIQGQIGGFAGENQIKVTISASW